MYNNLSKTHQYLFTPINNGSLTVFRILFGFVMSMEFFGALADGWVTDVYIDTNFNFTFIGFEFLHALHGPIMYWYYALMLLCAVLVCVGLFYRPAAIVMAILWTGFYFSQKNHYNNHYYLMVILCWLMVLMPANRRASLDVKWRRLTPQYTCERWHLLVFLIQIGIMYFFAAVAKMNSDWLQAIPLKSWFANKSEAPYVGKLFAQEWFAWFVAYGGLLFDLLITPAMLWKKTRIYALLAMLFFHFFNSATFGIGTFPYMAVSLAVFFFPASSFDDLLKKPKKIHSQNNNVPSLKMKKLIVASFTLYFILQLFLPIRHHFIKGDVTWTEEGHRMSWRMMLRTKDGHGYFIVRDKTTKKEWEIDPNDYLANFQVGDVAHHPDMTWQFAQMLKEKYNKDGYDVSVYAHCYCSLNGQPEQLIIDPNVDLAAAPWHPFKHNEWILPAPK